MGRAIFMLTVALSSSPSNAGAVAPGGEHHFSTSPGQRVYVAANPDPFFG